MSDKPTITPVGNMHDLLQGVCANEPVYRVGDYVWARNAPDASATRWLAHVESAHSVRTFEGRRWVVRVRRRQFWTSGSMHMYVDRRLTADEVTEHRRLGLIPPAGEQPS